jgi:KDO2-lipid IV(A) lauroyltransferase
MRTPPWVQGAGDAALAGLTRAVFQLVRGLGPDRAGDAASALCRSIGPRLRPHRTALANVEAAFPEMAAPQHREIVAEAWDNLGRTAAEYVHMERIWDFDLARPEAGRIRIAADSVARFIELREDGRPALIFGAHLANWELPAISAAKHGLPSAVLYRTPNNPHIARDVVALRAPAMGRLINANIAAPVRMMEALTEGLHVGMLVDQFFARGPLITTFGRQTRGNPLLARLARQFECPVLGARAIRLPGGAFRLESTPPLALPRDATGRIDVDAATQAMNDVIEGWVREYPGQWLWMHRRWRP